MIPEWSEYLLTQGARLLGDAVADFGAPLDEARAARTSLVVADLSNWGLIGLSGEEAQTFLHGQITNAVQGMDPGRAVFAGYCSAKGRMLANFLVIRRGEDLLVMLPEGLRTAIQKRLGMFILRAKVKARDAGGEWVRLGLSGPGAGDLLRDTLALAPNADILAVAHADHAFAIRLGDERFDLFVRPEHAAETWSRLAARARPVGAPAWDGLLVLAGIPTVLPQTQDQFVPQMANMDALHGISFNKGCYPGQEVVARSQYLGQVKRRLYLAHVDADAAPGDDLYTSALPGQSCGTVANVAPSPEGGHDLLAVVRIEGIQADDVRLGGADGPRLSFQPLPYPLPA
jgi:folate-binding protein YgfZ